MRRLLRMALCIYRSRIGRIHMGTTGYLQICLLDPDMPRPTQSHALPCNPPNPTLCPYVPQP